jgi:hypothetical protein
LHEDEGKDDECTQVEAGPGNPDPYSQNHRATSDYCPFSTGEGNAAGVRMVAMVMMKDGRRKVEMIVPLQSPAPAAIANRARATEDQHEPTWHTTLLPSLTHYRKIKVSRDKHHGHGRADHNDAGDLHKDVGEILDAQEFGLNDCTMTHITENTQNSGFWSASTQLKNGVPTNSSFIGCYAHGLTASGDDMQDIV